jgi:hypothetical protein
MVRESVKCETASPTTLTTPTKLSNARGAAASSFASLLFATFAELPPRGWQRIRATTIGPMRLPSSYFLDGMPAWHR